ncbi:MAG: response regulator [Lachnospiraceae bacterium]|nr:response regulator [Lachnospiraceae bacterium]
MNSAETDKTDKNKQGRNIPPIFAVISISFIIAIFVSIYSLTMLARENTKEIDAMLTYRIYDSISSNLNEPIVVTKTMACDEFLEDFLKKEDSMTEDEAIAVMQNYLGSIKGRLDYDTAFLVSEKSRRYYTYEGLNKIVDPENDDHDIWYSLFINKDLPYDLDVDSDEMNKGVWTVFVNARVEDEQGRLLGVCGVGVQMTNLQEMILEAEKEYNVKINFVDENGLVQVDTDDINIETARLDIDILRPKKTDEYVYTTMEGNVYAVTKYVEYLDWYLVVRSEPTSINREYMSVIIMNIALFLIVMVILIVMISVILKRSRKERDERERLHIVSERAVAASEAKSSFLSSMSHEIRTPINTVLGMNEMILRESKDRRVIDHATNIKNAGRTLLSLINSILDFSKIEEGKMEIVPVTYDTSVLVNSAITSVKERADAKGLSFIVDIDSNLPSRLIGDDVRLLQVIMNILTNAVKYTQEGHIRFTFREEKRSGEDIDIYVSVEDTGIGIKDADLPKLFESFERLDEVKNHGIEGTGLGMSIVINLLKMMDSGIHVTSKYGEGSTFYFVIRQKIADETPMGDYMQSISEDHDPRETLVARNAKVLVVDDNDMNLKVAKNLLGLFMIKADLSASGSDAIEQAKKEHYHLILLDHMMPEMDGIETLAKMRKDNILPADTKVIALTANAINGAKEEYLRAGFDDYLSKPIVVESLEELLNKWLPEDVKGDYENDSTDEYDVLEFAPIDESGEKQSGQKSPGKTSSFIRSVSNIGLDAASALKFCGGDAAFYEGLLFDYVNTYEIKKRELDDLYSASDWDGFSVKIHALKSVSKTVGAASLAEKALLLEKASKEGLEVFIKRNYPGFSTEYENTVASIRNVLED